jgi:hypothetical protein
VKSEHAIRVGGMYAAPSPNSSSMVKPKCLRGSLGGKSRAHEIESAVDQAPLASVCPYSLMRICPFLADSSSRSAGERMLKEMNSEIAGLDAITGEKEDKSAAKGDDTKERLVGPAACPTDRLPAKTSFGRGGATD